MYIAIYETHVHCPARGATCACISVNTVTCTAGIPGREITFPQTCCMLGQRAVVAKVWVQPHMPLMLDKTCGCDSLAVVDVQIHQPSDCLLNSSLGAL